MMAEVCSASSSSSATPHATITALAFKNTALAARVMTESSPNAAMASRSLVSSTRSLGLAVALIPGVKVSQRPMIEVDGSAMVRAGVDQRYGNAVKTAGCAHTGTLQKQQSPAGRGVWVKKRWIQKTPRGAGRQAR